ncbi:MAG TPA: hypothetical protein VE712_01345, partial [Actinomycetota bacterium]|nr:hypothetical protein [Actinomycetota bacterium]
MSHRAGSGNSSSKLGALSRNAEPEQLGERWVYPRKLAGGGGLVARLGLACLRLTNSGLGSLPAETCAMFTGPK